MIHVTDYGAWVDVEGCGRRGLILIPDISWGRVSAVADHLTAGDRVRAVVIHDPPEREICLGLKQLVPDPWEVHRAELLVGAELPARAVSVADYGVFVEVFEHVEVLVHERYLRALPGYRDHPSDVAAVGQALTVRLQTVDVQRRRIEASLVETPSPQTEGPGNVPRPSSRPQE